MESTSQARNLAALCHLLSFVGYFSVVGFVVAPLILWLVKRHDHPFIDDQGRESLNFQITIFLLFVVSMILTMLVVGLFLIGIVLLYHLVFTIVAAVKASGGEAYRYPLTFRFLK